MILNIVLVLYSINLKVPIYAPSFTQFTKLFSRQGGTLQTLINLSLRNSKHSSLKIIVR